MLLAAYARYRGRVPDPWPLTCCGKGELKGALAGAAGVEELGFVQPGDLRDVLARAGAFVLASRFDLAPHALHGAVEVSVAGFVFGPAGGEDAGRAAERRHDEARVVGDRGEFDRGRPRLERGVLPKRGADLVGLREAELARRAEVRDERRE